MTRRRDKKNNVRQNEENHFAEWGCVQQETAFYSFNESRNYVAALADKEWGDAARTEWKTIADARCIVEVNPQLAKEEIEKNGADLVILFPVYEEKLHLVERSCSRCCI